MTEQNNGSSNNEYKPAPWEKEANSMDDGKKNVSFISGLALLLSVLALVMVGWWGNVADTAGLEQFKKDTNAEIAQLKDNFNKVDANIEAQQEILKKTKAGWQYFKLQELEAQLGALAVSGSSQYQQDVANLQKSVRALMDKMKGAKQAKKAEAKVPAPPAAKPDAKAETKADAKADKKAPCTKPCPSDKDKKAPCPKPCPHGDKHKDKKAGAHH